MEAAPRYLQSPETLRGFFFVNNQGVQVPLTSFARITTTNTPLAVNHDRGTPASTISFSLAEGVALSDASDAIRAAVAELDRKSTRLNSSHLVISYAVFCLKKKKIKLLNNSS